MTIFALALGPAGCGDDKNDTTTSETTPATSSATEPAGSTTTDPTNGTTTDTPTTTASSTDPTNGTTTDPTNGSTTDPTNATTAPDSTGGVEPDTKWPPPDLNNPMMPCPEGYEAASFVMGGLVCAPKCSGPGKICSGGDTGTAMGACVFNPDSSGAACKMGDMCMDMAEMCQMTGGGGFACLAPSSHCALLCTGGESCPAGMECMGKLVCQYPTP